MENKIPHIKLRPDNDIDWDIKDDSLLRGSNDPINDDSVTVEQKVLELDKPNSNKTKYTMIKRCIVCGKDVVLGDIEVRRFIHTNQVDSVLCDDCKSAIINMKRTSRILSMLTRELQIIQTDISDYTDISEVKEK